MLHNLKGVHVRPRLSETIELVDSFPDRVASLSRTLEIRFLGRRVRWAFSMCAFSSFDFLPTFFPLLSFLPFALAHRFHVFRVFGSDPFLTSRRLPTSQRFPVYILFWHGCCRETPFPALSQ